MPGLRTEFTFTLPKGFVGDDGTLHRDGTMRLATARDEIEPLRDRSIDGPDDPYLTVLVLARVVTELGSLPAVTTSTIEGLFAADLAFLQDLYGIINFGDQRDVEALQASVLPLDDDRAVDASSIGDVIGDPAESESSTGSDLGRDEPEPEVVRRTSTSRAGRIEEVSRSGPV